uniref:Intercellular adhesion molecule 4 (Landsteiner-Wiener blood group) n=1 Tax=Pipistrellus kuhlii TaxID=59472 RepID=A0A7J7TAA4_PIPKU|nr:intercellular adhesion molecule 4 (Landsteiner-Wiener blood group) [Pipistrellus kuhlii]
MGFLLPVTLLVLLAVAYPGGRSARRGWAARAQSPRGSSPAPSAPSATTAAAFWMRISPKFLAVPPGSSVWLNCSSSCPLLEGSALHTGLRRGQKLSGPSWVSFQLLDVRAWSSEVRCSLTCAGVTRWAAARIDAYRQRVRPALPRDARVPRGLPGGHPAAWRPGHLLREPGTLHGPGSGQRDADLRVPGQAPGPLEARDLPRAPPSGRPGGRQQLSTREADILGVEPRVQSRGFRFHRSLCGDSSRPGGRLPAEVPTDAVPGLEGVVHAG